MASGGDLTVTDSQIEELAEIIPSKYMATIAILYFGMTTEMVDDLEHIHQSDPIKFNRDVLVLWRNRNYGINQVQISQIGMKMILQILTNYLIVFTFLHFKTLLILFVCQ